MAPGDILSRTTKPLAPPREIGQGNIPSLYSLNQEPLRFKPKHDNAKSQKSQTNPSKKCLVLGGEQLKIIENSIFLTEHFPLLLYMYNSIICYKCSARDKLTIAKLLKSGPENFNRILAIGDGLNDAMMMRISDVCIQISGKNRYNFPADFQCNTFHPINDLMFCHMINLNNNIVSFSSHVVFKNIFLGGLIYLLNRKFNYAGVMPFGTEILPIYDMFYVPVVGGFYVLGEVLYKLRSKVNPFTYYSGIAQVKISTLFWKIILPEGLLLSCWVWVVISFVTHDKSMEHDWKKQRYNNFKTVLNVIYAFVVTVHLFLRTLTNRVKCFLVGQVIFFTIAFIAPGLNAFH
jgi:magnesium-transporting ATPase (P-type)